MSDGCVPQLTVSCVAQPRIRSAVHGSVRREMGAGEVSWGRRWRSAGFCEGGVILRGVSCELCMLSALYGASCDLQMLWAKSSGTNG